MADKNDELRVIEAQKTKLGELSASAQKLIKDGEVSAENREAFVNVTKDIESETAILNGARAAHGAILDMERDDDRDAQARGLTDRSELPEASEKYSDMFAKVTSRDNWDATEMQALREENKDFYALDGSGQGAILVPTETERNIIVDATKLSPLLRISNTRSVSWRARNFPRGEHIGVAPPRKEGAQYLGKELSPSQKEIKIGNYGFMMSHPNEYIDDAFGLSNHIAEVIAPVFAETVEEYAIKGAQGETNFANQVGTPVALDLADYDLPIGLLNEDPEYVKVIDAAASAGVSLEDITALRYGVRPQARNNGNWVVASHFLQLLESLKDADGRPLWQPSLQDGEPDRIRGRGAFESENMQDVAAGNTPAFYGAFGRAHKIFIRRGITVRRSQHYLFGNNSEAMAVDMRWGSGVLDKGQLARLQMPV